MDTQSTDRVIPKPAGVAYPSKGRRLAGMLLDLAFHILPFTILSRFIPVILGLDPDSESDVEIYHWLRFLPGIGMILFYVLSESLLGGTVGKLLLGMRVVDSSGKPISILKGFARALARIVSILILWVGCLFCFGNDERQNLHCQMTDTYVVMNSKGKMA